jgi:uncharacterized protein
MRVLFLLILSQLSAAALAGQALPSCAAGTYRLSDNTIVDVAPAAENQLRWRRTDGTTGLLSFFAQDGWKSTLGWTGKPDRKSIDFDCRNRRIAFDRLGGARLAFRSTDVRFDVEGASLVGRLILPEGKGKVPIAILVHGAERDSALESYALQRLFPAAGIGTFVYDKRGTGSSGGQYTQDYLTLAGDAIAAAREARRLAGSRAGRVGYQGGSQGGWVAPLAASIEPVDFVIVSFGLAVSPLSAERESIEQEVASHISGPEGIKAAAQFGDAIERVVGSGFRNGFDQLEAVRSTYGREPWFKQIGGEFARFLLNTPLDIIREKGPALIVGAPLHYDPMPVIRNLDTPQLWLLGAKDRDAFPGETARRLTELGCKGRPIGFFVFPDAEHGMYQFEVDSSGERLSTRQPEQYFALMRDFILNSRLPRPNASEPQTRRCA